MSDRLEQQSIILRSESIVTTLEGDLLDSLHQSNLLIIYNVVLVHAVEPRIVTPKNQFRFLEIAPIISECYFLYRAWGFSSGSITDVIMSH